MISYQTLLQEIEQLVASMKNSKDDQKIREQLSAIRALCNVGLSTESSQQGSQSKGLKSNYSATTIQPTQILQSSQNSQNENSQSKNASSNSNSLNGEKLQENDANGESIFDF